MPLINFQKQFADAVESGAKRQTIRKLRKRPFKVGDRLYFYTGSRFKPRKIGESDCREVNDIIIGKDKSVKIFGYRIWFDLDCHFCEKLARDDGFKDYESMLAWFQKTHGLPFEGQIIKW